MNHSVPKNITGTEIKLLEHGHTISTESFNIYNSNTLNSGENTNKYTAKTDDGHRRRKSQFSDLANMYNTHELRKKNIKIDISKGTKGLITSKVKQLLSEFTKTHGSYWEAEESTNGFTTQLECMRSMIRDVIKRELDRRGYLKENNDPEDYWMIQTSANANEDCQISEYCSYQENY